MSEAATSASPQNWRIDKWFPNLNKEAGEKLKAFYDLIVSGNKTLSLIGAKTVPFADAIHFSDSLMACEAVMSDAPDAKEIYDLGSGNGFPGLVGAIAYPQVKFVLVDTDEKKSEYLKQCVERLGLKNVEVKTASIESLPQDAVQFGMARGLSNISKTILISRKCFAKGGVLYHLKSENWAMEVGEIPTQLCSVWAPALVKEYRLPIGEMRFAIVKTTKIG
ncbi:MAG: 16S rRNA (guanine(527)-N(7))-methyltransferase RsmG [Bdellovibrionales bacterium]